MKEAKFGISLGMGFKMSVDEQIETIGRVGYASCFTGWGDGCAIEHWADVMAKNNIIYQSVHAPFTKAHLMWEDEGQGGEDYTDMLIRCVKDCAKVGVKIMVAHVIIGMDRHSPNALGLNRFERLVKAGEENGVVIAFENTEGIEYLQAVMDEFKSSPACGFCWDTGHEMCYNYSEDVMARFGDKLVATHINDNLGMADRNNMTWLDDSHLLPFDGIADWQGVVDRLDKYNFNGIYTMELTRDSKPGKNTHAFYADWSFEVFVTKALERGKRIAALSR